MKTSTSGANLGSRPSSVAMAALRWLLMGAMVLSLTGCVWLRLLAFKNQLKDFDNHVTVHDTNGLSLRFTKPVLVQGDVQYLFQAAPTSALTNGDSVTWLWTFEKVQPANVAEAKPLELTFNTLFVSNKLEQFEVPPRFLSIIPKQWLLSLFRSLGQARIDQSSRGAAVHWAPEKGYRLLTKSETLDLLGAPLSSNNSPRSDTLLYKFRLVSPSISSTALRVATVTFGFAPGTGKLASVQGQYADMHLHFIFEESKTAAKQ